MLQNHHKRVGLAVFAVDIVKGALVTSFKFKPSLERLSATGDYCFKVVTEVVFAGAHTHVISVFCGANCTECVVLVAEIHLCAESFENFARVKKLIGLSNCAKFVKRRLKFKATALK